MPSGVTWAVTSLRQPMSVFVQELMGRVRGIGYALLSDHFCLKYHFNAVYLKLLRSRLSCWFLLFLRFFCASVGISVSDVSCETLPNGVVFPTSFLLLKVKNHQ